MSMISKLILYLVAAAVVVLLITTSLHYHSGLRMIEGQLQLTMDTVGERLVLSLRESVNEYDRRTIHNTVAAEFPNDDIEAIRVVSSEQLLCCLVRRGERAESGTDLPAGASMLRRTFPIRLDEGDASSVVGEVEILLSRKRAEQRLIRATLAEAAEKAVLIGLLVLVLAYIMSRFLVTPLQTIHQAMIQTREAAEEGGRGGAWERATPLPQDFAPHFNELAQMAASYRAMVEAIYQSQHSLAESRENLRITLNSIGDAVIATDAAGRVTQMNPVAEGLTGWTEPEARGGELQDIFKIINASSREPAENPVERVMARGELVGLANHTILIARDGTERQIADSGAPIRDQTGAVVGVVLVFRDVTEQYQLEEQLRQSQKMDSVGRLAGGVAHDFNNMIAGIMSAGELLQMKLPDDSPLHKYVTMIGSASAKAADLTDKLLTFSRKGALLPTPVDIHDCITDVADILQRSIDRRIGVHLHLNAHLSTLIGDRTLLENMFLNFGLNARDAMPEGGALYIETSNVTLAAKDYSETPFEIEDGAFVRIEVRDTGCGIPADVLSRVFEPFFTTKGVGEGTGLGLSASFGTVQEHHGVIAVTSKVGKGTCFTVYLPVQEVAPAVADQVDSVSDHSATGTILIVDDEDVVRVTLEELFSDVGYKSLAAADGKEAVAIYKDNQEEIDLVLLDLIMPRQDGKDTFRELKSINPSVRVVVSSGYSSEANIDHLRKEGVAAFIAKPYRSDALLGTIRKVLQ